MADRSDQRGTDSLVWTDRLDNAVMGYQNGLGEPARNDASAPEYLFIGADGKR